MNPLTGVFTDDRDKENIAPVLVQMCLSIIRNSDDEEKKQSAQKHLEHHLALHKNIHNKKTQNSQNTSRPTHCNSFLGFDQFLSERKFQ